MNMPIIRLDIERMRETITQAFMAHSADMDSYVKQALDTMCTEEFIQDLVTAELAQLVPEIIKDIFGDYTVRRHIKERVVASIDLSNNSQFANRKSQIDTNESGSGI